MTAAAPADDDRHDGLLGWQHRVYAGNHTLRSTLVIHLIAVPLFWIGCIALVAAPFTSPWVALGGLGLVLALVLEGRAHNQEPMAPIPADSVEPGVPRAETRCIVVLTCEGRDDSRVRRG
jgi:hypothetical protein